MNQDLQINKVFFGGFVAGALRMMRVFTLMRLERDAKLQEALQLRREIAVRRSGFV